MAEEKDGMKLVVEFFFETLRIRQNKTWEPLNLDTSLFCELRHCLLFTPFGIGFSVPYS